MNALIIAWIDLKRLSREREALFWIFVGPVIFTAFFGVLFRARPTAPIRVVVVNQDARDYLARTLTLVLERDELVVTSAARVPPDEWALMIPPGATDSMAANKPVKLVLHAKQDEETNAERSLRFTIQKALTTIYLHANPGETTGEVSVETFEQRLNRSEVITIARPDIGVRRREVTSGFQRSVPSYLVMFVFLNLLVSGAGIAEERVSGKLRRLFIAPVRKRDIVLGKLLTRFGVGWIQIAYMLLLGVVVFKIQWAEHTWAFFAFLTVYALASASLGMLFGTLFKDPDKCATMAIWTAIVLAPLGGLWWPLEIVGPTMRKIAYIVPTGWAMEGVNAMLAFGADATDVAPFAAAFVLLFIISLTLAARRLTAGTS